MVPASIGNWLVELKLNLYYIVGYIRLLGYYVRRVCEYKSNGLPAYVIVQFIMAPLCVCVSVWLVAMYGKFV